MTLEKTKAQIDADWRAFQADPIYVDVLAAAKTGTLTEQALFAVFCAGFNAGGQSLTGLVRDKLAPGLQGGG